MRRGSLFTLITLLHPSLKIHVALSCNTPVALFSSEDMASVSNKAGYRVYTNLLFETLRVTAMLVVGIFQVRIRA